MPETVSEELQSIVHADAAFYSRPVAHVHAHAHNGKTVSTFVILPQAYEECSILGLVSDPSAIGLRRFRWARQTRAARAQRTSATAVAAVSSTTDCVTAMPVVEAVTADGECTSSCM